MPAFNYGEILSSLFTWIKIGVCLALLVLLGTKVVDVWEETQSSPDFKNKTENVIRY